MLSGTTAHDNSGAAIVGSIASKSSSDLTVSGRTVTVPAGYYPSDASGSVGYESLGTPYAEKGTVSNHSIVVTPKATFSGGYVNSGTKTGTGVSVSASDCTSGNKAITSNGTNIDVTNYKTVSVSVTATPSIGTDTIRTSSTSTTTLRFASVSAEPKAFFVRCTELASTQASSNYYVMAVRYNGTDTRLTFSKNNVAGSKDGAGVSFSYSGTTLTVNTNSTGSAAPKFYAGKYELTYIY